MAHFGPDLTNVGHTDELARIFGIFVYSSIPSTVIVILGKQEKTFQFDFLLINEPLKYCVLFF